MRQRGVAIVVQNLDSTGGMERQALQLAKRLARSGVRVWLFTSVQIAEFKPRLPGGRPFVERHTRLTIYRVPLSLKWEKVWFDALYELVIAGVLGVHASRVDAIYAVQWMTARHAAPVARLLDCPLFVKFAGGGHYGDLAVIGRSPERAQALEMLATAKRLVCISPQIAEEAREAGLPAESILRIPNGVDLSRFEKVHPARLPGPDGAEHVLFVGALRVEKRLPDLVRSFARVAQIRPKAQLVIAGEGAEETAIRTAAREMGLEERIHLLGRRNDVPELLAGASVFVLTSASEGLSNALLEAMAAGTPIVATDIDANRAVVEHEKEALLIPLGDPEALGRAIVKLLDDRELALRLSRAGLAKVRDYDLSEVARRYRRAFRETARPLRASLRIMLAILLELAWPLEPRVGPHETLPVSFRSFLGRRVRVYLYWAVYVPIRDFTTSVVVRTKRFLHIEGEILVRLRLRRAPGPQDRLAEQARSKT
jgi:glycosyltransferase involved in cell wall biosynthesis